MNGQGPYALSQAQLSAFAQNGYLLVEGLFAANAAELRREGHEILHRLRSSERADGAWSTSSVVEGTPPQRSLLHCHDPQFHSALFSRMLLDPSLVDCVADLLGSPNVQLHHNKFFVKPPAVGAPFPLHQDWPFFPHVADSPLAAIVHLDAATEANGCVRVIPGSHRAGRLPHQGERDWFLPPEQYPLDQALPVTAQAGDVLFFGCLAVHGSGMNRSEGDRTTWLIQFRDPDDAPTVDRHRSPGQGTMLRGRNAGDRMPPATSL